MSNFTKELLSGSTDGRMIKVAATATAGTLIHTAQAGTSNEDEIWLWAVNSDTVARKLTIEYGGVAVPDDLIEQNIAPEDGLHLICPGLPLRNALIVRAFAETADVVMIAGFINRISG